MSTLEWSVLGSLVPTWHRWWFPFLSSPKRHILFVENWIFRLFLFYDLDRSEWRTFNASGRKVVVNYILVNLQLISETIVRTEYEVLVVHEAGMSYAARVALPIIDWPILTSVKTC